MTEPIQIVPEKIHIRGIRLLGGRMNADGSIHRTSPIANFNIRYDVTSELMYGEKTFRFIFSTEIDAIGKNGKSIGIDAQYSIEYMFFVENIDRYISSKEEHSKLVIFHPILPNTLLSIVYSTSRGIILSRTQGTIMDGVVLPVIDVSKLLQAMENHRKYATAN